ncbi:hypothetical protein V3C99_010691 [Haemonchus contortus]
MLQTLLRLLHLVQLIVAYNLVIDTQTKGITSYIRNLRNDYEVQLEKQSIPTISKKRCLGIMELADIKLANVGVESTLTVVVGGDYYLRIEHLHAHLQGIYQHNFLFISNTGGFQFAIRDLNASLGPLVPVNIGGIPYINQDISCRIWHIEENMELTGGILRWLARKRLTDIMKEDLESILCDSLVEVLDTKIRKTLAGLNLVMPINGAIFMSYLLVGQPLLLPYGAVRTYHQGITSTNHHGVKFAPFQIGSNHHAIYHIHEALLSETVQSVCSRGYMDGNITVNHEKVHVACQTAEMSVKNMEASNTANIMLNILLTFQNGIEKMLSKNYTVSILHSSNLAVLFRLKSEIVKINEHSYEYDDQIFTIMSEVLRAHVRLPLPVPAGAQIDRPMIKLLPDRIIFATDFVFKGG